MPSEPKKIPAEGVKPLRVGNYEESVALDRFGRIVRKMPEGLPRAVEIQIVRDSRIQDCSGTGGVGFPAGKLFELNLVPHANQRYVWLAATEFADPANNVWLIDAELRFTLNGNKVGALPIIGVNPLTTAIDGFTNFLGPGIPADVGGGQQPSATMYVWTGGTWTPIRTYCLATKVVADKAEVWIKNSTGDVNSYLVLGVYIQSEYEGG